MVSIEQISLDNTQDHQTSLTVRLVCKSCWLVLSTLLLVMTVACAPHYDSAAYLMDVLTPQDCELPCWHGIVPGQSSKEELLHALEQLPDNEVDQLWQREVPDNETWIGWQDSSIGSSYEAYFQEETLAYIESHPILEVTLEELVAAIGSPDRYIAKLEAGERTILTVLLFYEELGVQVSLWDTSPGDVLISELKFCGSTVPLDITILNTRLLSPQIAESMIKTVPILQFNDSEEQLRMWSDEGVYLSSCNK